MAKNLVVVSSVSDALQAFDSDACYLAGGTEINRLNSSVKKSTLISMKKISELKKIEVSGESVKIGSMVSFQELIDSKDIPEYLKDGANNMGARTKRNMATLGGNIASMRDDSYIIPTLIGAKAKLELKSSKGEEKEVCICEYQKNFADYKDMLIVSITVPKDAKVLNKRYANTKESLAAVTVSVGKHADGKISIGCAIKNLGVFKLSCLGEKFESGTNDAEIKECVEKLCKDLKDDFYGSASYKKYLLTVTLCDMYKEVN